MKQAMIEVLVEAEQAEALAALLHRTFEIPVTAGSTSVRATVCEVSEVLDGYPKDEPRCCRCYMRHPTDTACPSFIR